MSLTDPQQALAEASGLTVLAKGPDTVLCAPDGTMRLFAPGPSWLSTAGTGDVLAEILRALDGPLPNPSPAGRERGSFPRD